MDERTVTVNAWSSAEWALALPAEGTLGSYSVRAVLEADRPKPKKPEELRPGEEPGPRADDQVSYEKSVHGNFLVAAYRRPDFRVDVKMTNAAVKAGEQVKGTVIARSTCSARRCRAGRRRGRWTRSPGYRRAAGGVRRAPRRRSLGVRRRRRTPRPTTRR